MKIAIIGAGAIGSVVAAYLHKAGIDVVLVGKKEQADVILKGGLSVKGARGNETFKLKALTILDREYDLVIFTTKTQDIERAYSENSRYLEDCTVLTTQNGVQADNLLGAHIDKEKLISSIVMFGATYVNPGEVTFNFEGDWILGRPFGANDPKTEEVAGILKKAFSVVISRDIMGMKWLKLFVNFNNCLPALIGKSMQETFADMDFCKLAILLLKEGVAVTQKSGVNLVSMPQFPVERVLGLANMPIEQAAGIINKTLTSLSKEPLYGSILQSIMRKRTSEIDYINGEIVSLAKNTGHQAPLNRKVVDMVHEVEEKSRFFEAVEVKKAFILN